MILIIFSIMVFLVSCDSLPYTNQKPNILIIVADDLGYSDMSFLPYASEDVSTPNIDRLAENGVFFSNAYATAPICSPSRAGLITGRYQQRWGNYWYSEGGLPANEKTLPQMLKDQGYYSVKIGKTHVNGGPVEHPLDHGFDEFLGFIDHTWDYLRLSQNDVDAYGTENADLAHIGPLLEGREPKSFEDSFTTDIFTNKAVDAIRSKNDQPLFIELEFNAVHHPTYIGHPDYLEKYGIKQFPFWNPEKEKYMDWHMKWGLLRAIDPDGRKRYLLQLEVMDNGIGKILDALEATGKMDNTIIIFLSDNGGTINTYAQNDPLNGYKYMFGEGGYRIPMILSYPPKISKLATISKLVSAMDIVPTLLETVGAEIPDNLDGKSLWKAVNTNETIHEELVWSNGRDSWVVRQGKWKLAHNIGWAHNTYQLEGGVAKPVEEFYKYPDGIHLFDLENDIGETTNLADKYPEKVKALTDIYNTWRSEMSNPRTGNGVLKKKPDRGNYSKNKLQELSAQISSDGYDKDRYNSLIIDGYDNTYWKFPVGGSTKALPHYIGIHLKSKQRFSVIKYTPAPDNVPARVSVYKIYISDDGENWGEPIKSGELPDTKERVIIKMEQPVETQHIKFEAISAYRNDFEVAITEFDIE